MSSIRVCVGMSGGVDSTTTAHLLLKQGYEVFGATMYLFDTQNEEGVSAPPAFIEEARQACERLGIKHYVIDLRKEFSQDVIKPFVSGFLEGKTPNPCVICNKHIKYGKFMDAIMSLGADFMATGHYVRLVDYGDGTGIHLKKGVTDRKDQSYFLYSLSKERLAKLMLPLGTFESKDEIRKMAQNFDQKVASKKDSLGVCFTLGKDPFDFVSQFAETSDRQGMFVDQDGNFLGTHNGYFRFTIGQKKNLPKDISKQMAVVEIIPHLNQVVIGKEENLYKNELTMDEVNFIHQPEKLPWRGVFRICTWGYDLEGILVKTTEGYYKVVFDAPVRAIAKGQSCVFYSDDEIIGGGTIR